MWCFIILMHREICGEYFTTTKYYSKFMLSRCITFLITLSCLQLLNVTSFVHISRSELLHPAEISLFFRYRFQIAGIETILPTVPVHFYGKIKQVRM